MELTHKNLSLKELSQLALKELIDKNKGKIWVESVKGRGTVFYFSIPGKE